MQELRFIGNNMSSIQQLNPRHYKILEFYLRGWTNKQIADNLNITQCNVSVVTRGQSFQHEVTMRREKLEELSNQSIVSSDQEVTDAIREGTKSAVDRILGCIHSDDENVAIRASTEILDRGGFPKVSKIESKSLSVVMNAEDLVKLKEAMLLDRD
ncbi:hypothetical protein LCGC14_2585940 [marine sediment metagenome]|uniref:HTH luxR-type domain-containing protein n=1 Tax=marine sediment metagenome TaxID=412755 RepID=A0A0F9CP53_9ZZZZ